MNAEQKDVRLGRRIAAHRDEPATQAVAAAGKLGDQEPLYLLAAGLGGLGLILRRPRLVEAGVRMGLAVAAADLAKSLIKKTVTRTRPHVLMDEGRYESHLGGSDEKPEQSFPSGHMAGSVAAALAARRVYPQTTPYTLAACAVLGWGRVGKGAHWPSDVAAGAVVGLVCEAATARLVDAAADAARRRAAA
jgi:membrane-associated phospholipid phosphatase